MRDPLRLRNFRRWAVAVDTRPFLREIDQGVDLWLKNTRRQTQISVQRETNAIYLCKADTTLEPGIPLEDVQATKPTDMWSHFPQVTTFLNEFAERRSAGLQRAMIVRLQPNGNVYPHVDDGKYYAIRDLYHLILQSAGGSKMTSGDETAIMQQGELWWFNNHVMHDAKNESPEWRVHVIFDLLPAGAST